MAYKNLQHFIQTLEERGELVRIKERVNPHLEIAEITDRISKQYGPALLFENTGYDFPVLINSMGTEKRMALALGVERLDDVAHDIEKLFKSLTAPKNNFLDKLKMLPQLGEIASWMPKVVNGKGECQQVVMHDPDVTKLPVLKCWPEDGGPFITLPVIQTRDPLTGIRNVGLYRMQVFDKTLTAMHWHRHKVSARHFNEYKKLKQRMPVVLSIGGDPVYSYSATAPLPDGVDEFMLAGFLRKKRVELVQCLTQDMQVPADADIIIEGYIDPEEEFILEGPFGDHTGYYSLADYYPRFHITAITHRKDAVYMATIVGIPPQEDAWIGKATERIFLAPIKMTMVPEIVDMVLPVEGVFHNLVIVKIKKDYPGQALKVMNSLWGAGQMMFTKMMIIVDASASLSTGSSASFSTGSSASLSTGSSASLSTGSSASLSTGSSASLNTGYDVNIHDHYEVAKYISENVDVSTDIIFTQGPTDVLDHSCSRMAFGGKMGIDATKKLAEEREPNYQHVKISIEDLTKSISMIESEIKNHGEIAEVNSKLLSAGIPLIFIAINKTKLNQVKEVAAKLFSSSAFRKVKVMIFLDHNMDVSDIADAVWRFSNNVDPKRDHQIIPAKQNGEFNHIVFDGTRKTKELDGFDRDWPNILASDEATIKSVDAMWDRLGLGKFIPSPSAKYRTQLLKGGAVVEE